MFKLIMIYAMCAGVVLALDNFVLSPSAFVLALALTIFLIVVKREST